MELLWLCFLIFVTGACIGSFLNVVSLRALTKESIVLPASKCPKCGSIIKWYDNIPIFSYFFTFKGKCRNCKESVSKQYPIIEALTGIVFLAIFIAFGFTLKSLLLLILICTAIIITITDLKKEYVFESHAWILIISAIAVSLCVNGIDNYAKPAVGLIVSVVLMEAIAKLSYYLVRKRDNTAGDNPEENKSEENSAENSDDIDSENFDINDYIKKNKRAFGEGDTYLAAAAGALLGWQYFILAVFMAIVFQAAYILPQFTTNLYNDKQYRLLFSLSAFVVFAIVYWIISNLVGVNFYLQLAFVVLLIFFAIDTINRLKQTVNNQGFSAIPFGPALLISMFTVFFLGESIAKFIVKHIFMS